MEEPEPGTLQSRFPVKILKRGSGESSSADVAHGELRRPWRRRTSKKDESKALVMATRNYKIYAEIGSRSELLTKRLTVLDTGDRPNFIRKD